MHVLFSGLYVTILIQQTFLSHFDSRPGLTYFGTYRDFLVTD